jgi:hypothetical protein
MSVAASSGGVTTSKFAADRAGGITVFAKASARDADGAPTGPASGPYSLRQSS